MNKLFFLITLCIAQFVSAQDTTSVNTNDFSMYVNIVSQGKNRSLLWYTHTHKNLLIDVRYNFDWQRTGGAYIGHIFTIGNQWIAPEAGMLFGEYNAIAPEFVAGGDIGTLNWFWFGQYSKSLQTTKPDFVFNYIQLLWKLAPHADIRAGFGEQTYFETSTAGAKAYPDMGPLVLFSFPNGMYLKPFLTFDPLHEGNDKVIIGAGCKF